MWQEKKYYFAGNRAIPNSTPEGTPLFGIATAVIVNFSREIQALLPGRSIGR
jgi:hypothetical protein